MKVQIVNIIAHGKHNAQEVHECSLLENVEHCGGDSEQADTGYCATHQAKSIYPPTCTSIYHSQGV